MDGWMDGRTNERTEGWMDGWNTSVNKSAKTDPSEKERTYNIRIQQTRFY